MHRPALPSQDQCEQARLSRDARFDGLFFTAVRSTGIYCRPVCPAPVPRKDNVSYYASAAAAAADGYRPCLRCRPELSPDDACLLQDRTLNHALALLGEGILQEHPVSTLAKALHLSPRQLQRLFVARLGATPAQLHATRRILLAKQLLSETTLPVTQVALAAGFNSLRRFNSAFRSGCGLPPSALRRQAAAPAGEPVLRLAYRPPLDFAAMLAFLRKRAIPGIEQIDADSYRRVIVHDGHASLIRISANPGRHELRLQLGASDPRAIPAIVARVRRMFDLDANLDAVHACLMREPLLARGIAERPGLRVPRGRDGFEAAVRALLGQQVSV